MIMSLSLLNCLYTDTKTVYTDFTDLDYLTAEMETPVCDLDLNLWDSTWTQEKGFMNNLYFM